MDAQFCSLVRECGRATVVVFAILLTAASLVASEPGAQKATIVVVDDLTGRSPYQDWEDQGMRPVHDRATLQDEITPLQANLINAAYGGYGWRDDEHCCAGCPQCIRKRATPSNTHHYCGYYVGGGVPCFGEGRYFDEGTFGWDYLGITFPKKVGLQWTHWRYQGGTGAYKTDGPHIPHH